MVNNSSHFIILSLIYIVLLNIIYRQKSHLKSAELRLFGYLLFENVVGLMLELGCIYIAIGGNSVHTILINKLYLCYLIGFCLTFLAYILSISLGELNYNNKIKLIKRNIIILFLLFSLLILLLPINIHTKDVIYSDGPAVNAVYVISMITIIIAIFYMIINIKNVKLNRYVPLFAFIIGLGIVASIQKMQPSFTLITVLETFVLFIMYFTIENPDLKMLREFHKQRELANESNQEKSTFLFNMSKQIKQPIETISNISSEALIENDIEQIKEAVRQIKASSNDLHQIVDNVLDISELEKRKIEIRGNRYNVYNLFSVINKTFEKGLNKNIEYRFNYDKSIPEYLYGDSIRLKQIMNILLENALKYTIEGFIEVNINSIVKHDICRLIITVEDSGIGMSTEEIKHLFDKEKIYSDEELKKVDDTKNNLGILKSIVSLMNGNVLVNSELGKGSKFTVVIDQKVKEEKTKIIETVEQYEEMYENKERILLVINHKDISKKINKMFKKDTYEIEEVSGGQACLEKIRKNEKIDLIVMEEDLEKLSSEDTLIKLKDTTGYKIPVILISNNKGFGAKEKYQEKGYSDVLFLPFKKEQVIKIIEEYIEK